MNTNMVYLNRIRGARRLIYVALVCIGRSYGPWIENEDLN